MSAAAFSSLLLLFAAAGTVPDGQPLVQVAVGAPPASVAAEPMFANIVAKATGLKARVEAYRNAVKANPAAALAGFSDFRNDVKALSQLDLAGSDELRSRGQDTDLKCILNGISVDLPFRLGELEKAATPTDKDKALRELSYLLNDNVEVITAPPIPAV